MRRNEILLDKKTLGYLVEGAAFLGSGGGGMISAGEKFIEKTLRGKKVSLITPPFTNAQKQMMGCIVCDLGSITAFNDDQDKALEIAFKHLVKYFDELEPISALVPIETGAENSMAPVVLASMLGLSVIDCDGAGRAVPTLPLTCFSAIGKLRNPGPVSVASGKGDALLVGGEDAKGYESLLRPIASLDTFKNSASLAMWPDRVGNFVKKGVTNSVSRSIAVGNLLAALRNRDSKEVKGSIRKVNNLKGVVLAAGRVTDVKMNESNASNFTTVKIENQLKPEMITVLSKNENLIAYSDKRDGPAAIAPDSICYLKAELTSVTNSEIAKDDMIYLIAVEANAKLRRSEIKKGFDGIIQELGYGGSLNYRNHRFVKLGDLIKGLRKIKID